MCARYSLIDGQLTISIGEHIVTINIAARYNIAPSQKLPVIVHDGQRPRAVQMTWGWKRRMGGIIVNAKSENLKTIFKDYRQQRCLIPADGFYEWTKDKTPIRFMRRRNEPFCFAGLWRNVETQPADVVVHEQRFLILTKPAENPIARFHDRMPVIIQPEHYDWWVRADGLYQSALNFPDETPFDFVPVQRAINHAGNEGPHLIQPGAMQGELW